MLNFLAAGALPVLEDSFILSLFINAGIHSANIYIAPNVLGFYRNREISYKR
jgi:hypothetical protein